MSDVVKVESTRFVYSLLFFVITLVALWFLYPKLLERGGKVQAEAYWKAEREANEKRLFGGED